MPRLIWTPAALQDIARLHGFLKSRNPDAARRAVTSIRQGVKLLGAHPEAGRPVEHMDPAFREWPIGFGASGYIVLYRIEAQQTVMLAVRHSREIGYYSNTGL